MDRDLRSLSQFYTQEIAGQTRRDLYSQFIRAAHEVIDHNVRYQQEELDPMTAGVKVNLVEALSWLETCPVCSDELKIPHDYPLERVCGCGTFTVTDVWPSGEVSFEFKMAPMADLEAELDAVDDSDVGTTI